MPTVTHSIDIAAPPETVWAMVADYARDPEWHEQITSARWTSSEPHGLGSTLEIVEKAMGRELASSYEVTEYDAPRTSAIRSTSGALTTAIRRVVEPTGDGSRVRQVANAGPTGGARLFSPLFRVMMEKAIRRDFERLKQLLES